MTSKRASREDRIAAKQKEVEAWVEMPACNPWQYSQAKASYPIDPNHLDFRDRRRYDRTRLHEAVLAKDRVRVEELLNDGANPWVVDRNGNLPVEVADGYFGDEGIASLLRDRMQAILESCLAVERETGRKLGRRSQRRKSDSVEKALKTVKKPTLVRPKAV